MIRYRWVLWLDGEPVACGTRVAESGPAAADEVHTEVRLAALGGAHVVVAPVTPPDPGSRP